MTFFEFLDRHLSALVFLLVVFLIFGLDYYKMYVVYKNNRDKDC